MHSVWNAYESMNCKPIIMHKIFLQLKICELFFMFWSYNYLSYWKIDLYCVKHKIEM